MTQLKIFIKLFPEYVEITFGQHSNVRKVNSHDTTIETAIVFMLTRHIVLCISNIPNSSIGKSVRSQETTTTPLYSHESQLHAVLLRTSLCLHRILDHITHLWFTIITALPFRFKRTYSPHCRTTISLWLYLLIFIKLSMIVRLLCKSVVINSIFKITYRVDSVIDISMIAII